MDLILCLKFQYASRKFSLRKAVSRYLHVSTICFQTFVLKLLWRSFSFEFIVTITLYSLQMDFDFVELLLSTLS